MLNRNRRRIACITAALIMLVGTSSQAIRPFTVINIVTFKRSVALPGVRLPAGTYVFEQDPAINTRIVGVFTRNRRAVMYLGPTVPVTRPAAVRDVVSFDEAPPIGPVRILAWYPIGSTEGHKFVY